MTHERAFELVAETCPNQAGLLWNTTAANGCDTAWAIAHQYSDDEESQARAALEELAAGCVPEGWEPAE